MSLIDEALRSIIVADSATNALISGRFYPMIAPQGAASPFITYQKIDTIPVHALGTTSKAEGARFQLDCWAKTVPIVKDLANKLKAAIDGVITTALGVQIFGIVLLNEIDFYEEDSELYRISLDFRVLHRIS